MSKPPAGSLVGHHNGRTLSFDRVVRIASARWPSKPLAESIPRAIGELLALPPEFRLDGVSTVVPVESGGVVAYSERRDLEVVAVLDGGVVRIEERERPGV